MIAKRLQEIKTKIEKNSLDNKNPAILVAVSKTFPVEKIVEAYEAGQRHFGESRVQELHQKATSLFEQGFHDIIWHFIGHLQSNKMNLLLSVPGLQYIHSIDSLSLLEKLYQKASSKFFYFLEINSSGEKEKFGIKRFEELIELVEYAFRQKKENQSNEEQESPVHLNLNLNLVNFAGLMTIGPIRSDDFERSTKEAFALMNDYRDRLHHKYGVNAFFNGKLQLSMGMSDDFEWALMMGSDYVRVGSALFGN